MRFSVFFLAAILAYGQDRPDSRPAAYANRFSKKSELLKAGGGDEATEAAVLAALKWLARHQSENGSWKARGYTEACPKNSRCTPNPGEDDYDTGVTGLALLAFLGAGYSHISKEAHDGLVFGDVVRKGLAWMLKAQDADGCLAPRNALKYMYSHIFCTTALVEDYGISQSKLIEEQAGRAVAFLLAAQNKGKGWRYAARCGDNDSSVTGWALHALHTARTAGLSVPKDAFDGARAWFDEATDEPSARVGYTARNSGGNPTPNRFDRFEGHPTLTAMGITGRLLAGGNRSDPILTRGLDLVTRDTPTWEENKIDYIFWHHGSNALFQMHGPAGAAWKAWFADVKKALLEHQNRAAAGCKAGSWEPADKWSLMEAGRVYATAINALTLETPYRFPRLPDAKK